MSNKELDVAIAEKVMGWKIPIDLLNLPDPKGNIWGVHPDKIDTKEIAKVPSYSTDLATAHSILPRIKELGLIEPFIEALLEKIDTKQEASIFNSAIELEPWHGSGWELLFDVLAASPEAICQAALEAVEGGKK